MSLYQFGKNLVLVIFKPIYRMEVHGAENFPKEGSVLLCSNHIDNLDPPIVGACTPRMVHFMAKEELFKIPVLGKILIKVGAFPVKRGLSDREALRKGLKILKDGEVLGLFPEGTRSKDGKLGKGLAGAGFFALRSNALVVPCAVVGPYKPFRKVRIYFGEPLNVSEYRENKVSADEMTGVIMNKIGELLEKHQ
ncbi:1-acyl-sn-glycerol-3-phosphate acyltransferase [Bacillus sp. FJAT-42376]|uniref:lysophospholipid acyltransferase family protein n=1 Tax=Bacillus sp. FJAT-42376 TaxID=2014076 RepID=UPI000F514BD3|nr:lysophospholipid acyltransferase family protein [Bacillus sp. FJAT-42376]AZB43356.1 1-acyl-sn-glycerol-3-phosphate acyltransferase [Bacillus sp. FJAT-42376]